MWREVREGRRRQILDEGVARFGSQKAVQGGKPKYHLLPFPGTTYLPGETGGKGPLSGCPHCSIFFGQLALLKPESHCQEVSQGRFARGSPWNLLDFFLLPSHKRGCRKLRGIKGPEYGHPRETDQGYGSECHGSEIFLGR